jgi:hypothetical protein
MSQLGVHRAKSAISGGCEFHAVTFFRPKAIAAVIGYDMEIWVGSMAGSLLLTPNGNFQYKHDKRMNTGNVRFSQKWTFLASRFMDRNAATTVIRYRCKSPAANRRATRNEERRFLTSEWICLVYARHGHELMG